VLDSASWIGAGLTSLPPWQKSVRACLTELGVAPRA
jgi:dTDP-4-dehydrorhamnose reductase